ncbi:hypothetical protein GCM10023318_34540 [Nocardia callitridis]|uniref:Uncharacterized protein n=1 Tax=Nocardia callitridis TaxID=648753 RepID=A0ABP9KHI0_9NOCA
MFQSCHSPHDVAYWYADRGFPVELTYGRALLQTSYNIGAVKMPREIATTIRRRIGADRQIPILAHTRNHRETIVLVGPSRARGGLLWLLDDFAKSEFDRHGICEAAAGTRVWLPMSDHTPGGWYWASPPTETATALPPRNRVLRTALEVIGEQSASAATAALKTGVPGSSTGELASGRR